MCTTPNKPMENHGLEHAQFINCNENICQREMILKANKIDIPNWQRTVLLE